MSRTTASLLLWASFCLYNVITLPLLTHSTSSCNQPCSVVNDCGAMLICINGNCNDDDLVNAQMCPKGKLPSPTDDTCRPFGHLNCTGQTYPQYNCSPPVTSSTQAFLLVNDFSEGGDGGAPSECDGKYHDNSEPVAALSTGWYDRGSRCGKMIRIVAKNGTKSVTAKVVDECDSVNGCDEEHGDTPPCANNNINGNKLVWDALGLDENLGEVAVTWSMA